MKPEPTEPDYAKLCPEELAERGIFTSLARQYDDRKNPHWIIPNQKIVVVNPNLPGLQDFIAKREEAAGRPSREEHPTSGEVIPRPPALENSLNNFSRSFFDLLTAWLRWLFGGGRSEPKRPMVGEDGSFGWFFDNDHGRERKVSFKIVRASECPNGGAEFGKPSVNVLLEWELRAGQGNLATFADLYGQADNILIANPEPPNNMPGDPTGDSTAGEWVFESLLPLEFKIFDATDAAKYSREAADEPIVAVMDTGLKYKWDGPKNGPKLAYWDGRVFDFKIAKSPDDSCLSGANFGYCGIGDYLRRPAPATGQLAPLAAFSLAQIRSSPYDDHLVKEKLEGGEEHHEGVGRHGTLITGILNRGGCQVLPVKTLNCAGWGTLFDALNGCNYLIARKRAGLPIKVINASFGGALNEAGLDLLYRKLRVLTEELGIWVVAAAGNKGISLNGTSIYPAQFGLPGSSGRPVLDKVITVNSSYDGVRHGNWGEAVALTAVSPIPGGFPSAIPLVTSPPAVPLPSTTPPVYQQSDFPITGTSFAAPYVACALARLALGSPGLSNRTEVLAAIRATEVEGVTFVEPLAEPS